MLQFRGNLTSLFEFERGDFYKGEGNCFESERFSCVYGFDVDLSNMAVSSLMNLYDSS